ncbi:MAG: D-alanyl-D-alanine carboxypeptidase [Bacilli bacterium]|nr:D-alanyl-D-alanine carboxypeptidase [Bacilli bacterium]MBP3635597.1 D-alanyl-D-alanine carboxypeptidase [Bacilli bacterium]
MKKILISFILLFCFCINANALSVPSNNAILIDQDSGRVLYSKSSNNPHLIASTTKIMTAVLAIESGKLDEIVTINESVLESHGSGIYVSVGEKITLRNLVYGLLLRSGNDAALAIEDYLGGHEKFVKAMNDKAIEIGMKNTTFNNASGLDDDEKGNYSTCYDMAILMKYANNLYDFREIDSTKKIIVQTDMKTYSWTNKNKLLFSYKYATGGKTGYTIKAKRTLVTSATKDNVNLIAVTFNDPDDFDTHKKLYEYGFTNYSNYLIINKDRIKIKSDKYKNRLYVKNNYYYLMTNNERENINTNVVMYDKMDKGTREVGYIEVFYKNKSVHKEYVYAK